MRPFPRPLIALCFALVACGHSSEPSATTTTGSGGPPPPSASPCVGGGPCGPDGAICTPETLGTGWAHGYTCSGGHWAELEIAPLPQPPPTPPPPPATP